MKILNKYKTKDLLYISIFAGLGLSLKPLITPVAHIFSSWAMLPGGALAGGLYMMWMSLTIVVVNKTGSGILFGITQGLLVIILGWFGNHGIFSLLTYSLPAILPEIMRFLFHYKTSLFYHILLCGSANLTATFLVTLLIMRLPLIPLLISLIFALISGIIGGILSKKLYDLLNHYKLVDK